MSESTVGQTLSADQFVAELRSRRASAILRTDDQSAARHAMQAAIAGGFTVVEFTLTIPGALELIEEFSAREGIIVGAGTVLTVEDAQRAVRAGAQFLVAPTVDPAVIRAANDMNVAMMPGCATPTEMLLAHRTGARLQKLFPEQGIGPRWVQQVLGPMPFLNIVPTAGVTPENAADYLRAGACAVGFVNSVFDPKWIAEANWKAIQSRATRALDGVAQVHD